MHRGEVRFIWGGGDFTRVDFVAKTVSDSFSIWDDQSTTVPVTFTSVAITN